MGRVMSYESRKPRKDTPEREKQDGWLSPDGCRRGLRACGYQRGTE